MTTAAGEMLQNRVRKNARHLRKWARREDVHCFRVYDRDIPEVPVAVDWYDGDVVLYVYDRHADAPIDDAWIDAMSAAAATALDVDTTHVYVKHRSRQRGAQQYQRLAKTGHRRIAEEGRLKFYLNLVDYLDTGLFLDHRPLRSRVRAESHGKRVLNLFAYTGSFSVYAAAGGAAESVSVDLSPTYAKWAVDNLALNGFGSPEHTVIEADVFAYLEEIVAAGPRFDLVVVDPPTFSNSKRTSTVLDIQRDHVRLLDLVLGVMAPGGVAYFSTNHRRFHLDEAALTRAEIANITAETIPPDFRDQKIHRAWRLARR